MFRVLLAALYFQQGRMDKAVTVLRPALALAAREGYVRVFLDAGMPFTPVLRECAAQGIEADYVAKLLHALRTESPLSMPEQKVASAQSDLLSERECEVLRLIAAGLSNPEIAEHLYLSVGTVKRHVHNIYAKLGATHRLNALALARERNLL